MIGALWTVLFPLGKTPIKMVFTIFFLWPLYYRVSAAYFMDPLTDFITIGGSFTSRLMSLYAFFGIIKKEDAVGVSDGFWGKVR